ncbi:MAG: hypothetical protein HY824_03260 [Acidobacteria bacterium]|nr:hypothetical protein [Acidobacteriota bacterium]
MKQRFVFASIGVVIAASWLLSTDVAAQGFGGGPSAAALKEAASSPTPKRTDGVPDFSGIWVQTRRRGENLPAAFDPKTGSYSNVLRSRTGRPIDFERDSGVRQRVVPREARPWYKPQYWERVRFNDVNGHSLEAPDPEFQCMPEGVPRIGLPQEIVQTDRQMIFLYPLHIRRIYIDGRPHPPESQWIGTWFGHSVGRWEGDTLVIDTVDFNGLEWLGWPGWITSPDKHVVERITRKGNTLTWGATVDDSIFLRPWTAAPMTRVFNTNPQAELEEPLPCVERDLGHIVTKERG